MMICTVTVSFLASQKVPQIYDIQFTALIFALYFIFKRLYKNQSSYRLLDSVVFTLIIMNLVNSTGGLSSPLFFLTYFLLFALSLMLEPIISMTTAFTIVVIYILKIDPAQATNDMLRLFSLPFLTPFALFMGNEYRKSIKQKEIIDTIEVDNITFISLVVKSHLQTIKELSDNFNGDHELEKIRKTIRRMEKLIQKYEDES